ncbi:MAG TPA: Asp-tRNA(Asn)/Glu-tRNA(Gln) amidotransferase subunit GatA [Vicinamibacterales bacterium]|jgi:aspartyl-tRNA(Asn)/glutamyl-tRNA(Gln) amidotransferase subunit A|nr:Asp-tRNA(Asn)/Glu-tRNA(Gln) amidotransferase subunit GatA [Vicinamibacterales bacterium]
MSAASFKTAREIRDAVAAGEVSAVEVCRVSLDRINALDGSLSAFLSVAAERALDRARTIDQDKHHGPLAGVPIAIKDNISTRGIPTTAGSRILKNYVPPYDATVITRLEAAGAVILGKTNCDEFAMGSSTENSAFGPSRNPWDTSRIPGGSSGGSAVAVAAGMTPIGLGSDTGGSIRLPASLCGVVGLKPTYGRVSRYGLIAFASSLDCIGSLTRTAHDAALALSVLAGPDPRDSTASGQPVSDYMGGLSGDIRGLRLGVPRKMLEHGVDDSVRGCFYAALEILRARGAGIIDIELPHAPYAISTYYVVATAEASSNLARFDGVRYGYRAEGSHDLRSMYEKTRSEGFGAEVKRRIMLGTYVLSAGYYEAYYLKAQKVRTLVRRDYEQAFQTVDAVAMPTSPTPAFKIGERVEDPLQLYLVDVFTVSANLAGLPAVSVPCGLTTEHLPIGLQMTGKPFDEATLLRIADSYERDTNWWKECPAI